MVTKEEVDRAIAGKDDFVKIDYLRRYLRQADSLDTRKYILLMLAGISENKNMTRDSVKYIASAAEISITFREKIDLYLKEAELWIRISNFQEADKALNAALSCGNVNERPAIQDRYIDLYRINGKMAENNDKKRRAIEIYEKLITLKQPYEKKLEIKERLLDLYNKMGRIRDYERIKRMEFAKPTEFDFR